MLGLDATAGASKARDAYFEMVKRLHPDRLPPPLAPLAQVAQRVFSALTDAHDTLLDEEKRLRYIGIVRDGGGTPAAQRKLEQTIEGTVEFQKAEVLRKSDAASAEQHARRAIELDPEQADYYALLAWILFERYPGDGAPLAEMLALVDKAIGMYEKHDRAHYYRGAVLRRSGREGDAVRAFRRAVELNPKNVDAQREVRLADMRAKKGGAPKSSEPTDAPAKPQAPKSVGQRDIGEMFKGLFSGKKK
jgi:curved DNA-binding protein CbpA